METRPSFLATPSKNSHAPSSEKLSLTINSQLLYFWPKIVSILSGRYGRVFRLGRQIETSGWFVGSVSPTLLQLSFETVNSLWGHSSGSSAAQPLSLIGRILFFMARSGFSSLQLIRDLIER